MNGGFVEVYITCNPPLLPSGVEYVFGRTKSLVDEGILAEILYEPDVPWFKCISAIENQEQVNEAIQKSLLEIYNEEIAAIDTNTGALIDVLDNVPQPDIDIFAEHPRVLPWSSFKSQDGGFVYSFNKYRFPDTMMHFTHKTAWRGIEEWNGGTLEKLLTTFNCRVRENDAPLRPDEFGEFVNCQISYNIRETMVYLGTDESTETLQQAVWKLQNILNFVTSEPAKVAHIIALEEDSQKLAYSWMSQLGLSYITYAQVSGTSLQDEYRLLLHSATLRAQVRDEHGRFIIDPTTYPKLVAPGPTLSKPFRPFDGYVFRLKRPFATFQELQKSLRTPQKPVVPALPTSPEKLHVVIKKPDANSCDVPPGNLDEPQHRPIPDRGENAGLETPLEGEENLIETIDADVQIPNDEDVHQPGTAKRGSSVDDAFIDSWRREVHNAEVKEKERKKRMEGLKRMQELKNTEDLISFNVRSEVNFKPNDENAYRESSTKGGELVRQKKSFLDSNEDLICFGSEPEQHILDFGLEQDFAVLQMADIIDTQATTKVTDKEGNPVICFGIKGDETCEFFETMHQKAGRDTSRANRGGLKQTGNPPAWMGSWRGPRGVPEHQRVVANPVTPMQEHADAEWPALGNVPPSPKKRKNETYGSIASRNLPNTSENKPPQHAPPRIHVSQHLGSAPTIRPPSTKEDACMEPHNQKNEVLEKLAQELESSTRELVGVLLYTPGTITLEARIGRIYLKQFRQSQVYSNHGGTLFTRDEAAEFMNHPDFRQELVGFSPILTTVGEEVNDILAARPSGEPQWRLSEKQTWCDFVCTFNDSQQPFVVEVEVGTFQFAIREKLQESFAVYAHCPRRAWDVKVCATHSNHLEGMPRHRSFAESLIAAMTITTQGAGGLIIGTPGPGNIEGRVEAAKIRQVARYSQKMHGSELSVSMFTLLEEATGNRGGRMAASHGEKVWTRRGGSNSGAIPHRWFEVCVSSTRSQALFEKNKTLEFGHKVTWDTQELEKLVKDICRPALALTMTANLDRVGHTNSNEQKLDARDAFHDGLVEQVKEKEPFVFW